MTSTGSVSQWIEQLKEGDEVAARELWRRYYERLVNLARKKLRNDQRRASDEEDVALEAFHSLCRGADRGCFTRLTDRDDLWKLLVVITIRKSIDHVQHATRAKRGGGLVLGESGFADPATGLREVLGREPGPEVEAQFSEHYRDLMRRLDDDTLRGVARWKMEGFTNEEIAARLNCVPRTVERKLQVIRAIWSEESP